VIGGFLSTLLAAGCCLLEQVSFPVCKFPAGGTPFEVVPFSPFLQIIRELVRIASSFFPKLGDSYEDLFSFFSESYVRCLRLSLSSEDFRLFFPIGVTF